MATAGLSFANPMLGRMGVGEEPNPYAPYSPSSDIGMGGLAPSAADMAVMGETLVKQSQFTMPEMRKPPSIAFSPSSKELFVNGLTFAADDAATALQSESYLRGPGTGLPVGGDWVPLDEAAYSQYLQSIRQPSLGRLASKSFGRGVDVMQSLAGRGLQLAGAEELGGRIVAAQEEDLRRTAPFERQFTDIESGRDAVEWFVANFAQQGPNLIESVVTAGLGFLAGTAVGGPAAGATAAMSGLLGKQAFKESIIAAAKKKAAGETLNAAENKLLREAAGLAGAVATSYTQNLATGAADIYGELRDQGANPEDVDARLKALAGSIPYAALETLPEFVLAGRIFGGVGAPTAIAAGTPLVRRGAELLRRGAVGGAIGGTAEGTTEAGQEALLLGISGQDLSSPEGVNRLVNSFAAGFGVGGPVGAVANLRGKQPANLLDPAKPSDPTPGRELMVVPPAPPAPPAPPGTALAPYYTPVTPMGPMGGAAAPQLAGPPAAPQLPAPIQPITPMGGPVIMAGMGPDAVAYQDQMLRQQGNVPPGAPGTQGVLDIFGGQISAQELAARMQPQVPLPGLPAPVTAPVADPRQGALQFAGPAPQAQANVQMANQLQAIQDRVRRQREFEAAQAQQQALIQQQTEELARQSANARDLYAMQQAQQQAAAQPAMPMRQAGPTQPQQLDLFTRRQAPRPSRAEALRRGVGAPPEAAPAGTPLTAAQRRAQLPLLTQEGQPSVAALRAAGVKTKAPPAPPKARATKTPGARGLKKGAKVAEVNVAKAELPEVAAQRATLERLLPKEAGKWRLEKITAYAGNWRVSYITADGRGGSSMPVEAEELIGKTDAEIKAILADRARKNGLKGVADAIEEGKLKQGRVAKRAEDNAGVRAGGQAGEQPKTQVPAGGTQAGGGGKPVVSRPSKAQELKKEPPPPKVEAAPAAPSAVAEAPIPLTLERSDGAKVQIKDGKKYQEKLDADIKKYEELLDCLRASR